MQKLDLSDKTLIKGTFLEEGKTRFVCTVMLGDQIVQAFVPMSCKLSSLIPLRTYPVLLEPIKDSATGLHYKLFALKNGSWYIPIEGIFANQVVSQYLTQHYKSIQTEKLFGDYRADFYIPKTKTIVDRHLFHGDDICAGRRDRPHEGHPAVPARRSPRPYSGIGVDRFRDCYGWS